MAGMCCGDAEAASLQVCPTRRAFRRRALEVRQLKFLSGVAAAPVAGCRKRRKHSSSSSSVLSLLVEGDKLFLNCKSNMKIKARAEGPGRSAALREDEALRPSSAAAFPADARAGWDYPKFGMTSVCGRRSDMEDSVAIHPFFIVPEADPPSGSHFFGVYDGHGCSHVAMKCKDRLHEIVKEELASRKEDSPATSSSWIGAMQQSFLRMDNEVHDWCRSATNSDCRCELQTPQCDAVGSTAVVAVVTPENIVVSNCGDSRAVLCRDGVAVPLSSDHKPDRPDELRRIQAGGGRVIYWDGPRVLGVLAMSRAIGDNYLKPYVIAELEATVTYRTADDEFLILASDGLWDVINNSTACSVVHMCLRAQKTSASPPSPLPGEAVEKSRMERSSSKVCSDASVLLTKLALARRSMDNVTVVVVDLRR